MQKVTDEVRKNQRTIVDWAQAAQAADMLGQSIEKMHDWAQEVTGIYQIQAVAETQLLTVMRQRMKATEDEVDSIKRLCSTQQELGVIGDEVQLSGAQQMATFLNEKSSLDTLIPAMNNLLALECSSLEYQLKLQNRTYHEEKHRLNIQWREEIDSK